MLNYGPAGKHGKITFYCSSKTRFMQSAKAGEGRGEISTFSKGRLLRREARRGPQVTPGDLFQSHIHLEVTHVLTEYHLAQQRISDHSSESGQEAEPGVPASPRDTWLGSGVAGGACVQESARRCPGPPPPSKGPFVSLRAGDQPDGGRLLSGETSVQLWGRQPSPQALLPSKARGFTGYKLKS